MIVFHPRRLLGRWRSIVLALLLALVLLALAASAYVATVPVPADPAAAAPAEGTRILDRHGRLLAEIAPGGYHHSVPFAAIPHALVAATLAAEDASFYSNPGVDPLAIARAL